MNRNLITEGENAIVWRTLENSAQGSKPDADYAGG